MQYNLKDIPNGTPLNQIGKARTNMVQRELPTDSLRIRASFLVEDIRKAYTYEKIANVLRPAHADELLSVALKWLEEIEVEAFNELCVFRSILGREKVAQLRAMDIPDLTANYVDTYLNKPLAKPEPKVVEDEPNAGAREVDSKTRVEQFFKQLPQISANMLGARIVGLNLSRKEIIALIGMCQERGGEHLDKFKTALGIGIYNGMIAEIEDEAVAA